jgi:hypothetical protein
MFQPGDIVPYLDACRAEGVSLQRGMNFRLGRGYSVILMSVRPGAPYGDRTEDDGRVLIYEGHDVPRSKAGPDPKTLDQPLFTPSRKPTQNGLFVEAARKYAEGLAPPELVRVYEKIKTGIWAYAGLFKLVDAWREPCGGRKVIKFRLELVQTPNLSTETKTTDLSLSRVIPTAVKVEVWKRDKGRCVKCGRTDNLHFDHILPFSKGGSSLVADNIQLLCARHNIAKRDKIE